MVGCTKRTRSYPTARSVGRRRPRRGLAAPAAAEPALRRRGRDPRRGRRGAAATRRATRAGTEASRTRRARAASELARTRGVEITAQSREAAAQIMRDHGPELRGSLWRLRKVRTPQGALQALEDELEHLLVVAAPTLVEHPLPVRRASPARVIVGGTAAAVAIGEGLDEVAALFSAGTTIAPSLPALVAAAFLSVAVEATVATSLRVHDLRAAGVVVSPGSGLAGRDLRDGGRARRRAGRDHAPAAEQGRGAGPLALGGRARPGARCGVLPRGTPSRRSARSVGSPPRSTPATLTVVAAQPGRFGSGAAAGRSRVTSARVTFRG